MGGILDSIVSGLGKVAERTAGHSGGEAAEAIAKGAQLGWDSSEGMFRSGESLLSRTKAGKEFVEKNLKPIYFPSLKQEYMPAIKAQETLHKMSGATRDFVPDAIRAQGTAREMASSKSFGNHKEVLIDLVHRVRLESGSEAHATNVADFLSTLTHDSFEALHKGADKGILVKGSKGTYEYAGPKAVMHHLSWREKAGITSAPPYQRPTELERTLRDKIGFVFGVFAGVAHLTQIMNPILLDGIHNVAKGTADLFERSPATVKQLARSAVLADETYYAMLHPEASWMRKVFHHPGLSFIRGKQIEISALAGKHALFEAAEDYIASGYTDKGSMVMLRNLGIDPEQFAKRLTDHTQKFDTVASIQDLGLSPKHLDSMRLTSNDVTTAMFRSADESMFISKGINTPYSWDTTPLRRTAFMYKHYAFSQGKFIKDMLVDAHEVGGMPAVAVRLAAMGVALPAAGELIKGAERLAHGDVDSKSWQNYNAWKVDPHSTAGERWVSEYLDAAAHVASFGLFYSVLQASKRRALANMIAGPIFGTTLNIAQDVVNLKGKTEYQKRHRKGALSPSQKQLGRDVVGHAGVFGPVASRLLFPHEK